MKSPRTRFHFMAVAQWRQMKQMPHFWNGKCNLLKANKIFVFFKICLNSPLLPHFIQTRVGFSAFHQRWVTFDKPTVGIRLFADAWFEYLTYDCLYLSPTSAEERKLDCRFAYANPTLVQRRQADADLQPTLTLTKRRSALGYLPTLGLNIWCMIVYILILDLKPVFKTHTNTKQWL
jgi:hypothetical protein